MIQKFVDRFMFVKPELEKKFSEKHIHSYADLVKITLSSISHMDEDYEEKEEKKEEEEDRYYPEMDTNNIHEIDDGHYQGNKLFVIPADEYQPSTYYAVYVSYGSCSGCDTLQRINDSYFNDDAPTKQNVEDYMMLALHIVQGLKII
jgi:hypothetical protein